MEQNLWNLGGGDRSIGQLLAAERKRQGISQRSLARALKVSAANLSRIEHGSDLRVSTLLELARALGLEPMLVPKKAATAVRSVLEDLTSAQPPQRGRFA
ncbi:MAG: helix-turn-helix transcriptional regulator [Candidatus Eremiobacteraeota bacterium]|nr:helix-turn-helix transcriptional regulator [Candidatus Eremiobacteraeota bacterium]MBC5804535.1 helix-turn-helix transcriptional regulator [Candidatus Eremiobacteraeota bacterium]MBC5820977.1 helix-turn-helix transcriptional regulator [Candidatus Eremiobacteraeota bacterium]